MTKLDTSVAAAAPLTSATAQSLAERVAAEMFARDLASQAMGMRIAKVGPGRAELTMKVRADMLNGHATCHGGFIFTLADSAFAFACNSANMTTVASGCSIEVRNQHGETIALFRGKSHRIKGHVIAEAP